MALVTVSFCSFDEEPILDMSDLNLLHVWVLTFALLITYFDLVLRARVGQYLSKDVVLVGAAFTFVWGLENYVRVLLLVFCLHNLLPLEIDLFELIEVYQT